MLHTDEPQFDAFRQESKARHGLSIAYIKRQVGAGTEYVNEVARVVLSPNGGFFELAEMPEEFAGALGTGVSHKLIAEAAAFDTLSSLMRLTSAVACGSLSPRALSIYALYAGGSLRSRNALYVLDHQHGRPPFTHGALEPDVLPRFLKLRFDPGSGDALGDFGPILAPGVHFLLCPNHTDSRHCLWGCFHRSPGQADLRAVSAASATMH